MKIIFLDIDGVLNSVRYDRERRPEQGNIDESRLPLLKRMVDASGAEIVLSSSWRKHWEKEEAACDAVGRELHRLFQKYGLQIADKTPQISARQRAEEIQAWLEAHGGQVESFVILDDTFAGWGKLQDALVKTDSRIGRGLEMRHVEAAVARLNAQKTETGGIAVDLDELELDSPTYEADLEQALEKLPHTWAGMEALWDFLRYSNEYCVEGWQILLCEYGEFMDAQLRKQILARMTDVFDAAGLAATGLAALLPGEDGSL